MDSTDKHFRRKPQQDRARKVVDAILEATARVVGLEGPESATTQRIAHIAGVSVGSLYQYFPAKDALFSALVARAIEDDMARIEAAVDEAIQMPFEEGVRHCMHRALELPLSKPRLFAWMMRYLPELGLLPVAQGTVRGGARAVQRLLEAHSVKHDGIDLEFASLLFAGAVRGALEAVARERPDMLASETFLNAMVELALGLAERLSQERPPRT